MAIRDPLKYKGTIVPWTTSWTGEQGGNRVESMDILGDRFFLTHNSAPGRGQPIFGSVHPERQIRAMLQERCDVCGGLIGKHEPKVLLHPGNPLKGTDEIGHVMAPSHRECARQAALVCPWILEKIKAGDLTVTIAKKYKFAVALLDPEIVEAETGQRFDFDVCGHIKMIVTKGLRRDAEWLMKEVQGA